MGMCQLVKVMKTALLRSNPKRMKCLIMRWTPKHSTSWSNKSSVRWPRWAPWQPLASSMKTIQVMSINSSWKPSKRWCFHFLPRSSTVCSRCPTTRWAWDSARHLQRSLRWRQVSRWSTWSLITVVLTTVKWLLCWKDSSNRTPSNAFTTSWTSLVKNQPKRSCPYCLSQHQTICANLELSTAALVAPLCKKYSKF